MPLPAKKKKQKKHEPWLLFLGICYQEETSQNYLKNGHTLVFMFMLHSSSDPGELTRTFLSAVPVFTGTQWHVGLLWC